METSAKAIELVSLTKDFSLPESGKSVRAVDGLSLCVEENTVFGLLGPNGSGKSTTIRILLGLTLASGGEARIFGESPKLAAVRRRIGYLPDAPLYHRFLSGRELMHFFGKLLGLSRDLREQRALELLTRFGLSDALDRKLGSYSKGMLQRLGFAQALIGDPDILVLDEPTAGVDPVGAAEVGAFVLSLKKAGKTVLLCSHLLTQVQDLCDAVGILNKGRLLISGKIEALLSPLASNSLTVEGLDERGRRELERFARERGGRTRGVEQNLEALFCSLVARDDSGGSGK